MTCREFKDSAAVLTLWELSGAADERILGHARQCERCGRWLQEQRALVASLEALQARTAGLQAGPDVERTVLQAFRQKMAANRAFAGSASNATVFASWEEQTAKSEERLPTFGSSTPIHATAARIGDPGSSTPTSAKAALVGNPGSAAFALRLSRFFEIGALVAVAAAIAVVMFLGVRLLQHGFRQAPVQSKSTPASVKPLVEKPGPPFRAAVAGNGVEKPVTVAQTTTPAELDSARLASASKGKRATGMARSRVQPEPPGSGIAVAVQQVTAEESLDDAEAGYVALMFCDPLSCATDSQVVRMELPPSPTAASQNFQPQVADVVVGYDGAVRAVRLVN